MRSSILKFKQEITERSKRVVRSPLKHTDISPELNDVKSRMGFPEDKQSQGYK
jgi:hypothetical protein